MTTCPATGKQSHRTLEDARRHAERAATCNKKCWYCRYCFAWHVGIVWLQRTPGRK